MNGTKVQTIDELPELPFLKILSYLSLGDRLKARAVSRGWYQRIKIGKVKSLCCSDHPSDFIWEKRRWVRGAYAQNFVNSSRIDQFLEKFIPTTLSDLKYLRLCDLCLNDEKMTSIFQSISSFRQLEELDIIRFGRHPNSNPKINLMLNLPMLESLHLEYVVGVKNLVILDSPRLQKVKLVENDASPSLVFVHCESVEKLQMDGGEPIELNQIESPKSLQVLYIANCNKVDSTLLSGLEQLKEIHTDNSNHAWEFFAQKQEYRRTDLKIYCFGCLLNGPDDPTITRFKDFNANELLTYLVENPTRQANEIPLCRSLSYEAIERVDPELAISLLKKFTDLNRLIVDEHLQDVRRFLELLKTFDNIARLWFDCDQPQELFDWLPEYCAVQRLVIVGAPSDLRFLFRLKHLLHLHLEFSIGQNELIRKILKKLPFLLRLEFLYFNIRVQIQIDHPSSIHPKNHPKNHLKNHLKNHPKRFHVSVDGKVKHFPNSNAAIRFIAENATDRML